MVLAEAQASLKVRLGIKSDDTDFDDILTEMIDTAVKRLYPLAAKEVPPFTEQVSVGDDDELMIDLSSLTTPLEATREVEAKTEYSWHPVSDRYHHGNFLRLRGLGSAVTSLRYYGLIKHNLTSVPQELEIAVLWYAMSDFYDHLAGDKRKYNIYMQHGGRQVENMRDESEAYDDKARIYLEEHSQIYGT